MPAFVLQWRPSCVLRLFPAGKRAVEQIAAGFPQPQQAFSPVLARRSRSSPPAHDLEGAGKSRAVHRKHLRRVFEPVVRYQCFGSRDARYRQCRQPGADACDGQHDSYPHPPNHEPGGWIAERRGEDRPRTPAAAGEAGRDLFNRALPCWEKAQTQTWPPTARQTLA